MKIDEERMFGKARPASSADDLASAVDAANEARAVARFDDELRQALGRNSAAEPTDVLPGRPVAALAGFDQGARSGGARSGVQSPDDFLREARSDMRIEPPDAVNRYMRRL